MTTLKLSPLNNWIANQFISTQKNDIYNKWKAFTNSQAATKTQWYLISMMVQGVLFLPIPAVLMYYYNASIIVLPITFGLYLANIIVGMGGSSIRAVVGLFLFSVLINLTILALYIF